MHNVMLITSNVDVKMLSMGIERRTRMTSATTPRAPMMRVPVFREAHPPQLASVGRETILVRKISEI